ncbi:MAG: hypothetical protein JJT89_03590 [Nitriliruptoraceae bacterium]|nr:hypothetical protein [Nitriliruptoraceae bacterium]
MDDARPGTGVEPQEWTGASGSAWASRARAPLPRPVRRWPWIVLAALLAIAAIAATLIAVDQYQVAAEWQTRAEVYEQQRDEAADAGAVLAAQVDDLDALLDTSEADVGDLEERLRVLADQLARAEDTATTVSVERDVIVELTGRIADATEALDSCITRLFELQTTSVAAFNRAAAGDSVDVEPLNAQAAQVTTFCNEARSAAASAGAAADRLAER